MSVQALTWVLENSKARHGPRHVLISIANHADREGRNAWPSVKTIAREARLGPRHVRYGLKTLEALGELRIVQRKDRAGDATSNSYSLPKMRVKQ